MPSRGSALVNAAYRTYGNVFNVYARLNHSYHLDRGLYQTYVFLPEGL